MWKYGYLGKKISLSAAILVLQLQGENFFEVEKFEISQFQAVHCVRKKAISLNLFNRFSKTFLLLKERRYFSFALTKLKFFQVEKFEISHFQAVNRVRKNAISPKVFNRFSKTFLVLKDRGK